MADHDIQKPKPGLGEQAYQRIRADIVWCAIYPGDEVSEAWLCERYGFGKAPIRQALQRLSQEGYVTSQPRRRHVVSPVTLPMVRDLFDLRLGLEPAITDRACGKVDRERLLALDAVCVEGYVPGDLVSEGRFIRANHAFHLEIARASGNARMHRLMAEILDEMTRMLHLGFVLRERPSEFSSEHRELIEALANNERKKVHDLTVKHIRSVRALTMDGIIANSSLRMANIVPTGPVEDHAAASGRNCAVASSQR